MTSIVEWLLGLESIRLGRDEPVLLRWNTQVEAWMLVCVALAALAWVTLVYRREVTTKGRRAALAALRCGIIGLVVVVLCQPSLVLQKNRIERSYVALVLDTSASMAATEPYEDAPPARCLASGAGLESVADLARYSRLELIRRALLRDGGAPLRALQERNGLQLSTFAGTVEMRGLAGMSASPDPIIDGIRGAAADGLRTDLAGAIGQVIEDTQGRRLAAIVLATDGQTTEPSSLRDALDVARGRKIPVLSLRVGLTTRPKDVEVGPLRAESSVFVNDLVAIEARLSARGLTGPTPVTVQLFAEPSTATLDARTVMLGPERTSIVVELRTKPTQAGRARYRVEAVPLAQEHTTANNTDHIDVAILEARLRVLYVEGYPRYEYRYLKNALLREEAMELSVLLIEADDQFVQEGTEPIRRFPNTPEELNRYDVVVFGDVDPRRGWLTAAQMGMLVDFVGDEGGGFGLIAGERAVPHSYLGTPLEKLVCIRIDPEFLGHYATSLPTGYSLQLTAEGRRSRLFRPLPSGADSDAGGEDRGNPFESLPELFWVARTLGPRPGASVLAEHPTMRVVTDRAVGSGRMPLVVTGRYGAGRVFFQATDDTWRWRRHTGELLHDTYWVQVARELMRSDRLAQTRRLVIRTESRVYEYGSPVHVQVDVSDTQLLADHPDSIELSIVEPADGPAERGTPVVGADSADRFLVNRFEAARLGPDSRVFEGTFIPPHPGRFVIQAEGIMRRPGERMPAVAVRVEQPDLEARRPEADHEVLEQIAGATGGRVLELDRLEEGFSAIRDRSVQIPDDITEPLWDSRLVLILFVIMITTEWVLRKVFGLT